jgi:hypothetical protein
VRTNTPGGSPDERRYAVRQLQGHDRGIDPRWNPTYQFTSPTRPVQTTNTHVLSVYLTVDEYPTTPEARRALVRAYGPYLVQEWLDRGLPPEPLYHLVHRPGELGPSEAQRIHRKDQGEALAHEFGGVAVAIVLANVPLVPELVVSRVRFE